jgi:ParB family chromosome partitioning protein
VRKLGRGLDALIPVEGEKAAIQKKETDVAISTIVLNPEQPRKQFDQEALDELAESIKEHGIIQPLIVTEADSGYELLAGQRRLEAAKIAGLDSVPVIIRSATQQQKLEVAIIENVQRRDLNPLEEALAYRRLIDEFNLTQEDVARRVGKARASVANTVRLLQLEPRIQKAVLDGEISEGHARALLSLDGEDRVKAFERVIAEKLSVRQTEQLSAPSEKKEAEQPQSKVPGESRRFTGIEEALRTRLGTKVAVSTKGKRGSIVISFFSREELERILSDLGVEIND